MIKHGICQDRITEDPIVGMYEVEPDGVADAGLVRVEIEADTLLTLLKGRRLCASDMRCLDCESKHCLWRLLLKACASDLGKPKQI